MYSMKETCFKVNMTYDTLKFYCNRGLVPNVKRDANNHRIFDDRDIEWLNGLSCLKNCGMSINEMLEYMKLCLQGASTIPQRRAILDRKRQELVSVQSEIQKNIDYIDKKQKFYNEVEAGITPYRSALLPVNDGN